MAEGHGGMRRPNNPAPVSGPGRLSRRTDGQGARYMAGGEYGEGQEMMDLQTSAPMSKTEAPAARPRASRGQAAAAEIARPTPLFAPTERPEEPITAGAPFGEGPGPAMPSQRGRGMAPANLEVFSRYLPVLRQVATGPDTPDRFKALVRYLEGNL
jgi:hypothetical protein